MYILIVNSHRILCQNIFVLLYIQGSAINSFLKIKHTINSILVVSFCQGKLAAIAIEMTIFRVDEALDELLTK